MNSNHSDSDHIIKWDQILLDKVLKYDKEPIAILNLHVHKFRTKGIKSVKDQWKHQ